jgi:ABC-type glycerol-3-phosphate transport system permease component
LPDKTREQYRQILENRFEGGTMSRTQIIELLSQYDALQATVRNSKYALWSVIIATVAAVASAISAAFSAYAVWPKR